MKSAVAVAFAGEPSAFRVCRHISGDAAPDCRQSVAGADRKYKKTRDFSDDPFAAPRLLDLLGMVHVALEGA
jgi:hypothetical protein